MIKKIFITICSLFLMIIFGVKGVYACVEGNIRCDSNSDLEICNGVSWEWYADCDGGCVSGECTDQTPCNECTSGNWSCSGTAQYYCNNTCWEWSLSCSCGCSGNKCKTSCSTPTPTEVPCGSPCNWATAVCTYACQTCSGSLTNGYKDIECWASQECKDSGVDACFTWNNVGAPVSQCPNLCEGVIPTPSSAPIAPSCQVYTCWDMGTAQCPYAFPGCPNGVGYCDNCGTGCGTCSGAPPGSTPVPTLPVCNPNCLDPNISPCITTTCDNKFCSGNCNQWCRGTIPNDCACAANLCSSQTCTGSCGDDCTGLLNCAPTTLERFEIRRWDPIWSYTDSNVNGRDITDAQNRLHICDSFLSGESPHPRSVVYVAWLNNTNGWQDIDENSVYMRWLGDNVSYKMTRLGAEMELGYYVLVTYPDTVNIASAQGFQITMKSIIGEVITDWTTVTPDLKLKVWDCQVPVSGTLYKAVDAVQFCPGTGFSVPIDVGVSFDSIIFSDSPDVTMTDDNLANYGTNNIVWGKTYLPFINGGDGGNIDGNLLATGRVTKLTDLGTGAPHCPSSQFNIDNMTIDPYSASPRAQIDFSFIRDQEAWYQVVGAGVKSRNSLEYGVPVTAPLESGSLTLGDATRDNGLVSAAFFENTNGNNNNEFGLPNNWWIDRNTNNLDIYNYNYFYNNFFVKAGVGVTKTTWGGWADDEIYFVDGNLNISSNSPVAGPSTQTMMVIVSGNITIQPDVTQLKGIYIADGSISAAGDSSNQLIINGMLYAGGEVRLSRSFETKRTNNTTPAVKVNYSPGLIFNLPPEIMRILSGWREE